MKVSLSKLISVFIFVSLISINVVFSDAHDLFNEDLLKFFEYREMGPARQGGRILIIASPPGDPFTYYVSTATGGLWKTDNNGTTFTPLFQNCGSIAIGAFAIAPSNPDILWVGTGTAASGRISLLGDGIYKSTDAGKTWQHMGLEKTIHIGRIAVHPEDPDIVYAAALGYHFSFNPERGLYKTTDGGKTWLKSLFISDKVGVADVVLNPSEPDIVYAATYDKWRIPWHFEEEGPESGIYKSVDGGETWNRMEKGLPSGKIGRIGLDIYKKNPDILYASVENANLRPPTEKEIEQDKRRGDEPKERPFGRQVYRTDDGGEIWQKMNRDEDGLSGGKWYGVIYIDPNNDQVIYLPSVPLLRSTDGGQTWGKQSPVNIASNIHVDHHALWIDPENSEHIVLGNDGGLAVSYDWGKTWDFYENLPIAQYYAVGVDMENPYNIYGGLQDNGSVKIPSNSLYGRITGDDWQSVGGGDGMFNLVDPHNSRWLYNESQFGYMQRVDQKLGTSKFIRPGGDRDKDAPPLRFNWTTPIHISPHNSQIIYFGANILFRSMNQGDDWQEISPDLTSNDHEKTKGNIEHCTLTSISESPITPGIIWVGSDDGKVLLTRNGGGTWVDVTEKLAATGGPADYYVSRVIASQHKAGTAYVVKSGFQRDDFTPHLYKTEDFGESWVPINGNIPEGNYHVIIEDKKNPDLLFTGNDTAVYVTIDQGKNWVMMKNNMPTNLIYDMVIHPRENDLIVATHGRGLFVTDITPLQEMSAVVLNSKVHLFEIEPKVQWIYKSRGGNFGHRRFNVPNEPLGVVVNYYLKENAAEDVVVTFSDPYGQELARLKGSKGSGLHHVLWNMRETLSKEEIEKRREQYGPRYTPRGDLMPPGEYVVTLEVGDQKFSKKARILPMPDRD